MANSQRPPTAPCSTRADRARPLVFLNASLSGLGNRLLNDQVLSVLRGYDVDVYAPQVELPLDAGLSPIQILTANTDAIKRCDVVISILDKPGLGVAYELGVAMTLERPILAFRSATGESLGKILDGLWDRLRPDVRATSLRELSDMLARHFRRRTDLGVAAPKQDPSRRTTNV